MNCIELQKKIIVFYVLRCGYRCAHYGMAVVADHLLVAVARVYRRFEYLDVLTCKLCTLHAAYQLFGLAREH